jgi:hypothetical protein
MTWPPCANVLQLSGVMSVDCGEQLVLNVTIGSIVCKQLLQTWPQCDASKCIQGRKEPTFNYIVDKQEPICTVSYARDQNLNVLHLCLCSCRTVPAQETGHERSLDCVRNVMAHAQKPDFVSRRNGRVHLNRRGLQFSRLLAAEVCASAAVMLDTPCSVVAWEYWLPTPFASFPFTSPPCVTVSHQVSTGLYLCNVFRFPP